MERKTFFLGKNKQYFGEYGMVFVHDSKGDCANMIESAEATDENPKLLKKQAEYYLQKIKGNTEYEFTADEITELNDLLKNPESKPIARQCLEHHEKKNVSGILELMQKKDVSPKNYADVILGTSAQKVVKEAKEKLTYEERRNPMRRYMQWLFKLSQDSGYQVEVRGFVTDYFNAELLKNIDGNGKEIAQSLNLWAKQKEQDQDIESTEAQIEKSKAEEHSLLHEEELSQELSSKERVQKVLQGNASSLEWDAVIQYPLTELSDALDENDFNRLVGLYKTPRKGKETKVRRYLQEQLTPETLGIVESKHKKTARTELEFLLRKSLVTETEEPNELTRQMQREAKTKAGELEQKLQPTVENAMPFSESYDTERAKAELQKMADIIKKAGFSTHVEKTVDVAIQEQSEEIAQHGKVDLQKEIQRKEGVYLAIQEYITEEIETAGKLGAEKLEKVIDRLEKMLEPFIEDLSEEIEEHGKTEASKREAQELLSIRTKGMLAKARKLCELAASDVSDEEILNALHNEDINENDDGESAENSKKIIGALLAYSKKIDAEAPQKKAEQFENRRYLADALAPYFKLKDDERFDAILGEVEEIAEKANIEAGHIQEALAKGELPELYTYGVVQHWAQEHNIPFLEATEIITNLAPSAEIVFMDREDFLRKVLGSQKPDEAENLLQWYQNRPATFARRFSQSGGNMRQYLLKIAEQDTKSAANFVTNLYADKTGSETFTQDHIQTAYETGIEKTKPIIEAGKPFAKRAKTLRTRLSEIRKNIPDENTTDAIDEIFRFEKMLEVLEKADNPFTEDADVLMLDRNKYIKDVSSLLQKTGSVLESLTAEQIESELDQVISKGEQWCNEIEKLPTEEQGEALQQKTPNLQPNLSELREQENTIEQNRKEKLQRFADWVVRKVSNEEGRLENDEIWDLAESLENLNGKKVLQKLSDDEFDDRFRSQAKAMVVLKNGSFEIFVRQPDWDSKNQDMIISLRHEGFHALDAADKKNFSKDLDARLRAADGFDYKTFVKEFCEVAQIEPKDFSDEIFAYMMAGDKPEIQKMIAKIPQNISEEFHGKRETYAEEFAEKGIRVGFFGGKKELARNAVAEISFDPKTKDHWQFELQTQIARLGKNIESLKKSNTPAEGKSQFISKLDELLHRGIDEASQPLGDGDEAVYDTLVTNLKETNAKAESAIITLAENQQSERGLLLSALDNTTFLSILDLISMFNTTKEFIERRHQRNQKLRTGKAGKAIFDKLVPNLANEFDLKKEEAESEEVGIYEKGLNNKDAWQIMDRVDETRNKDELKACFNVLSKEGAIDWYDRRIWKALDRVGSGVKIYDADANDIRALKTKLARACTVLWDGDYFYDTDRANGSNYQSGKNDYNEEIKGNVQEMGGMLESLLKQKRRGYKVNPQRFEAYLEKCVKIGKSVPENVFWYTLQGVHHGVLNMERINYFDSEYLNNYPAFDWFYSRKPKLAEVRSIAEMFPPTEDGGPPENFNDWYLSTIMSDKAVIGRTIKNATAARDNWDHDWSTTMLAVGNTSMAWQLLRKDNEFAALHLTAYPNMTVGQISYITNLARYKDRYDKKRLKEEIIRHFSYSTVISTALKGNYKSHLVHNLTPDELSQPARSSSDKNLYMSDKALSTNEILDSNESILKSLDPRVFYWIGEENISDRPGSSVENEKVLKIVQEINSVPGYEDLDLSKVRTGHDLLDNLSIIIKRAIKINDVDPIIDTALDVYKKHHGGKAEDNRIKDERGVNWQEHAQKTLGNNVLDNYGMYNN